MLIIFDTKPEKKASKIMSIIKHNEDCPKKVFVFPSRIFFVIFDIQIFLYMKLRICAFLLLHFCRI